MNTSNRWLSLFLLVSLAACVSLSMLALFEIISYNAIIILVYVLLLAAVVVGLVFPVINLFKSPRRAIRSLIIGGVLATVVIVSYFFASSKPINLVRQTYDNVFWLLTADASIITSYVLFLLAVVVILLSPVTRLFK